MKKNIRVESSLFAICFAIIQLIHLNVLAQTAKEGMVGSEKNYTSFGSDENTHPEKLNHFAPCTDCIEDVSERTVFNKKYNGIGKNKGLVYTQTGNAPINLRDKQGNWITYDYRLKKSDSGIYTAERQHFPTKIDIQNGFSSITSPHGEIKFNALPELIWKDENGETSLGKASMKQHTAGDDGVYIIDAWPGIDMEMRVSDGAIKTNYILKSKPSQSTGTFIIRDIWNLPDGAYIKPVGDELVVLNNSEIELIEVKPCVGFLLKDPKNRIPDYFNYIVNGSQVDIVVPLSTFSSSDISFPYIIDPLVTTSATLAQASILGSQYNASCNFTNSCNYTVNVPVTPSAVIQDVLFTFSYEAAGLCWRDDGATRVQIGGCKSPSQTGYYWFCNDTISGTCAANNVSIYTDVQGCLPQPSCNPANLPVTLQFFRGCWGAIGCSNTCIGAVTPFTVTIKSRTMEYTNPTTQISLSSTTICQNQTITATTSVVSGTAPISYNWSLNASGTPSVGNGNSVTIPFPTAGSHTIYSTVTDACGNVINSSRVVTVNPNPIIIASSNPATVCSGQSPNITLTSSAPSTTINWTQTQTGVTGASNGTGTSINQTLTNTGTTNGSATYVVTATANGCASTPINVVVNVSPIPTVSASPAAQTICSGTASAINLSSTVTGTTYTWTQAATGVTGASNGTGNQIAQTLTTSGTTAGTVTYTITPTIGTCTGTPITVQLTVNPTSNPSFTFPTSTVCNTGINAIPVLAVPGTTGTFSGTGVTFVNTATGEINVATTPLGTYTITFTTSGLCPSTSTQTITISSGPDATFNYASPFCQNGTNPNPILATGATMGTFSATPAGLTLNATTGEITLATSTANTYTVTNTIAASGGCAATSQTATVVIQPTDNSGFTYASNTFCTTGTNPTPTVNNPATTGTFSGAGVVFANTANGTINLASTAPGTYTITFTSTGPCPSTSTQMITIVSGPNATFSYASPFCQNGTNPSPTLATGAMIGTFSATPAGLTINASTGEITLSTSTAGTYTVTNTIAAAGGCAATSQASTVVIHQTPTATLSGGGSFCVGNTPPAVTITLTGSAPWNVGISNGMVTQTVPVMNSPFTYNPPIAGTFTLTSVSNATCNGTISGSVTIVQNPLPSVFAGNDQTICASLPITLSGTGANTYSWNNGITNNTPFTQPPGTVTYIVTGTDTNGCSNTDAVTITTITSPIVTLNTLTNVSCHGLSNGVITTNITGGIAPFQYTWVGSSSTASTASNLSSGTYVLNVSDNVGCNGSLSVTVTEPDSLVVLDSIVDYDCGIQLGSISLNSTGGTPGYTYNWTPAVSTSNAAIDLDEGSYQVNVTDANGCLQEMNYVVDNLHTQLFTFNVPNTTIDLGTSIALIIDTIPGLTIDSVSWLPADSLSCSNCFDPTTSPTVTTWYYATIHLAEGCSYTDSILITVIQPIPSTFVPTIFSPNADGENDYLCVRGGGIASLELTIFNRWGEIVFKTTHQDNCWDGTFRGKAVQTGVYIYKLHLVLENGAEELRSGNLTVIR